MSTGKHHDGPSLRPVSKFKFKHARIPMKGPRRTKRLHGRKGGVRY